MGYFVGSSDPRVTVVRPRRPRHAAMSKLPCCLMSEQCRHKYDRSNLQN